MRIKKFYLALTVLIAIGALFQLPARADEEMQTTEFTFSTPFEIPGQVLPSGTYIFERVDDHESQNTIHIFNADRTKLYATLQTVPAARMNLTDDPSITLAQQGSGKPDVIIRWFYSDRLTGFQFVYPKPEEKHLTQAKLDTFVGDKLVSAAQAAGE